MAYRKSRDSFKNPLLAFKRNCATFKLKISSNYLKLSQKVVNPSKSDTTTTIRVRIYRVLTNATITDNDRIL